MTRPMKTAFLFPLLIICAALFTGCGSEVSAEPRGLLLEPNDFPGGGVSVISVDEEQSLDGPSAQVELQAPGYRVLQSVVLYESRGLALSALDGIRADLVSRGETGPGGVETSGVFEHMLGLDQAASLFFIEDRALVRLTVTGDERQERLSDLAGAARGKIEGD